jgi:transposase
MNRRQFTKEFKQSVVQEVEAGLPLVEASRRYEIHPNLISKWRELYRKNGEKAFAGHGNVYKEEARIASLERKIGQLTMENEFLKKLIALDRPQKKGIGQ